MIHKIIISLVLFLLILPQSQAKNIIGSSYSHKKYTESERLEYQNRREEYLKDLEKKEQEKEYERFKNEVAEEERREKVAAAERDTRRLEQERIKKEIEDEIEARKRQKRELDLSRKKLEEQARIDRANEQAEARKKTRQAIEVLELRQKEAIARKNEKFLLLQKEAQENIFKFEELTRHQKKETETALRNKYIEEKHNKYPIFAEVNEGLTGSMGVKSLAYEFFLNNGKWPNNNHILGLPEIYSIGSTQINILPENIIEIKFKTKNLMDKTIELQMIREEMNGSIYWSCKGGTLDEKYRPSECGN